MTVAKIVSFFAGLYYLLYLLGFILVAVPRIAALYNDLSIDYNPEPRVFTVATVFFIATLVNFGFFIYLILKEREKVKMKNSLMISLALALLPLLLGPALSLFY